MNAFVVSGLVKRRAELAGDIENTQHALGNRPLSPGHMLSDDIADGGLLEHVEN